MKTYGLLGPVGGMQQRVNDALRDVNRRITAAEQRAHAAEQGVASLLKLPPPATPTSPTPPDLFTADSALLEQERTLIRAIDELYFRVIIWPGEANAVGVPTTTPSLFGLDVEDFPAPALTGRSVGRRLRELWPKTRVRFNLWYTATVGSTNLFTVGYKVYQIGAGMNAAAPGLPITHSFTTPGPAVANDVLFATHISSGTMLPAPLVCNFKWFRQGPDANANALRWFLAEFVLEEAA